MTISRRGYVGWGATFLTQKRRDLRVGDEFRWGRDHCIVTSVSRYWFGARIVYPNRY